MFSPHVAVQLRFYVYRLIDPRNGETFYVGRGTGNRLFAHLRGELGMEADLVADRLRRIRQIRQDGFEVAHVIHRHGMDEDHALEVEAALADAYPAAGCHAGHGSDERGLMHARQLIDRYEAAEAEFRHRVLLIAVHRAAGEQDSVYEAVRYAWKLDPRKAAEADWVLAVQQGLIIGVFRAERWLPATAEHFPGRAADRPGRFGFIGCPAPEEVERLYLRRRVPDRLRKRGAAHPVRFAL